MSTNIDEALPLFVTESRELLEDMEAALLRLEREPASPELLNAIFRAAHTIKGSAGVFGLQHIVAFTHVAESVLGKVREGVLNLDARLIGLFINCSDHMNSLVSHVAEGKKDQDTRLSAQEESLLSSLRSYLETPVSAQAVAALPVYGDEAACCPSADQWHISLRFGREVLRNGMDPLSFIRYLATFGIIKHLVTLADAMPPAPEMDAESCYLGFEIGFCSGADKATIEAAFEFVRDDCQVRILPPNSRMSDYVKLIRELPEEEKRLGEILLKCGILTQHELDEVLRIQVQDDARSSPAATSGQHKHPLGDLLVDERMVPRPVVDAALEKQSLVKQHKNQESQSIRVDAAKLDQLIDLVGELIIAGAATSLIAQRAGNADMLEATSTLARLVEEVRDSALTLRMVQIGATFSRFQRVVRDVSKELGKDIDLVISGAETELDKTVVEKIGDPLLHLVRNAIDHGIESADARAAAGKPVKGTLRLNAYHDSGNIVIEVSDDGRGLRREKILAKAVERGLVQEDQSLTESEVYGLIFEPGFSTVEQVTNLSGRGVGMDVVKRNITALRGGVDLESVEGRGTTVRIRLPLTLAIIDGFMVRVGKSSFVAPLDTVEECVELSGTELAVARDRHYINLRGEVLPFIHLRGLFGMDGKAGRRESIVVVQCAGRKAGIVVDELLGECQTVIKPLSKLFAHIQGISGSTILGSGEVALILDIPALMHYAVAAEGAAIERRAAVH